MSENKTRGLVDDDDKVFCPAGIYKGRLKERIYETEWPIPVDVDIVRNPDTVLKGLPCVVTGDSVILNECKSWFNMASYILDQFGLYANLTRMKLRNISNLVTFMFQHFP